MTSEWQSETADWVRTGAELFATALGTCTSDDLSAPSLLPGWTRAHVASHVSANAQAIGRLLHWARTGEESPMYSSLEDRDREIDQGARLSLNALTSWCTTSDAALQQSFASLPEGSWTNRVVTAQGRVIPASETLWMRSREVCIHAVDLNSGIGFADLPTPFLLRLVDEACARHSANPVTSTTITVATFDERHCWTIEGSGAPITVTGSIADLSSWLIGRGLNGVLTNSGEPAPDLPKWL
jgi:maleylpyruvate isomerase